MNTENRSTRLAATLTLVLGVLAAFAMLATLAMVWVPVQAASPPSPTPATAPPEASGTAAGTTITLMTHDSFSVSEEVLRQFEADTGIQVQILPAGDAGSALNQAILTRSNPLADVFFGVDNTFLSRALKANIFEPDASLELANIPAELQLDAENRLLPVDYGDVCLNYDRAWFTEQGVSPPDSLEALTEPAYRGLTVVENPATSSPGLAFMLTTIGRFGQEGYLDYWRALRANEVLVVDGWEEAYWGQFSAASDGSRPIVVSYASSPAAEVYFAETPPDEAPTAAVTAPGTCFRQVEFVGILTGTPHRAAAEQLVDFMLGQRFQEDIPLQMFVFPANRVAGLPDVFLKHAQIAEQPAVVAPDAIEANREAWIEAWTEVVLR